MDFQRMMESAPVMKLKTWDFVRMVQQDGIILKALMENPRTH